MAVDVGSTTIAAHLCDLASGELDRHRRHVMNPQIRFGEDLMSRVSYVDDEPRRGRRDDRGGAKPLINQLASQIAAKQAGVSPARISWKRPSSAIRSCIICCLASTRSSWEARLLRWPPARR
jgi:uncharacterized 2Fe-2S/4Fe-4S cluster protein (DUF4445 family)